MADPHGTGAGGRVASGYPNGPGHPGYPPDGGHAYAGPYADAYAGPYEDGYSGPYADAYSGGYAGPGVLNRPPGPAPRPRPAGSQQASRYPLLIGPDTGMSEPVIEGRRVLGWRRLVLLPRPLALALAGIAAVVGGAAVAKLTDRSMLAGGLRQFTAAFLATGVAFAVGHLIGGVVS